MCWEQDDNEMKLADTAFADKSAEFMSIVSY